MLAQDMPATREPVAERRRSFFDAAREHLKREWGVLILADNTLVPHGRDAGFSADGKPLYEREYDHGKASGRWRTWWPNGKPRMEATYGASEPQPMRWWFESGQLSSEGPAIDGVKNGEWTFFHENGAKASQGNYSAGAREGEWSFWNEDGSLTERGEFRNDARVGEWTHAAKVP